MATHHLRHLETLKRNQKHKTSIAATRPFVINTVKATEQTASKRHTFAPVAAVAVVLVGLLLFGSRRSRSRRHKKNGSSSSVSSRSSSISGGGG